MRIVWQIAIYLVVCSQVWAEISFSPVSSGTLKLERSDIGKTKKVAFTVTAKPDGHGYYAHIRQNGSTDSVSRFVLVESTFTMEAEFTVPSKTAIVNFEGFMYRTSSNPLMSVGHAVFYNIRVEIPKLEEPEEEVVDHPSGSGWYTVDTEVPSTLYADWDEQDTDDELTLRLDLYGTQKLVDHYEDTGNRYYFLAVMSGEIMDVDYMSKSGGLDRLRVDLPVGVYPNTERHTVAIGLAPDNTSTRDMFDVREYEVRVRVEDPETSTVHLKSVEREHAVPITQGTISIPVTMEMDFEDVHPTTGQVYHDTIVLADTVNGSILWSYQYGENYENENTLQTYVLNLPVATTVGTTKYSFAINTADSAMYVPDGFETTFDITITTYEPTYEVGGDVISDVAVAGQLISLLDESGSIVQSTTTSRDGSFSFPGTYARGEYQIDIDTTHFKVNESFTVSGNTDLSLVAEFANQVPLFRGQFDELKRLTHVEESRITFTVGDEDGDMVSIRIEHNGESVFWPPRETPYERGYTFTPKNAEEVFYITLEDKFGGIVDRQIFTATYEPVSVFTPTEDLSGYMHEDQFYTPQEVADYSVGLFETPVFIEDHDANELYVVAKSAYEERASFLENMYEATLSVSADGESSILLQLGTGVAMLPFWVVETAVEVGGLTVNPFIMFYNQAMYRVTGDQMYYYRAHKAAMDSGTLVGAIFAPAVLVNGAKFVIKRSKDLPQMLDGVTDLTAFTLFPKRANSGALENAVDMLDTLRLSRLKWDPNDFKAIIGAHPDPEYAAIRLTEILRSWDAGDGFVRLGNTFDSAGSDAAKYLTDHLRSHPEIGKESVYLLYRKLWYDYFLDALEDVDGLTVDSLNEVRKFVGDDFGNFVDDLGIAFEDAGLVGTENLKYVLKYFSQKAEFGAYLQGIAKKPSDIIEDFRVLQYVTSVDDEVTKAVYGSGSREHLMNMVDSLYGEPIMPVGKNPYGGEFDFAIIDTTTPQKTVYGFEVLVDDIKPAYLRFERSARPNQFNDLSIPEASRSRVSAIQAVEGFEDTTVRIIGVRSLSGDDVKIVGSFDDGLKKPKLSKSVSDDNQAEEDVSDIEMMYVASDEEAAEVLQDTYSFSEYIFLQDDLHSLIAVDTIASSQGTLASHLLEVYTGGLYFENLESGAVVSASDNAIISLEANMYIQELRYNQDMEALFFQVQIDAIADGVFQIKSTYADIPHVVAYFAGSEVEVYADVISMSPQEATSIEIALSSYPENYLHKSYELPDVPEEEVVVEESTEEEVLISDEVIASLETEQDLVQDTEPEVQEIVEDQDISSDEVIEALEGENQFEESSGVVVEISVQEQATEDEVQEDESQVVVQAEDIAIIDESLVEPVMEDRYVSERVLGDSQTGITAFVRNTNSESVERWSFEMSGDHLLVRVEPKSSDGWITISCEKFPEWSREIYARSMSELHYTWIQTRNLSYGQYTFQAKSSNGSDSKTDMVLTIVPYDSVVPEGNVDDGGLYLQYNLQKASPSTSGGGSGGGGGGGCLLK